MRSGRLTCSVENSAELAEKADYKALSTALTERFSPHTATQELRWLLSQRVQGERESLDEFADALIHLANRGYSLPGADSQVQNGAIAGHRG